MRFASAEVAVSGARSLVANCLRAWGIPEDTVEDARLITSELVTDAIVRGHAHAIEIEVVDLGDDVVVAVDFLAEAVGDTDDAIDPPLDDPRDRGIAVIDALGQTWGRVTDDTGGRSWSRLSAPARRRASTVSPVPVSPIDRDLDAALVALSPLLSAARTPAEIERAATTLLRQALGAATVAVAVIGAEGRTLRWRSWATVEGWAEAPARTSPAVSATPAAVAVRQRRALFHESLAAAVTHFPGLDAAPPSAVDAPLPLAPAAAYVPLTVADEDPFGAVGVYWSHGRVIDGATREWVVAAVAQVASAWQRAALSESYRRDAELLQRALLPQVLPVDHAYDLGAAYRPVSTGVQVGGDWYDAFGMDDGTMRLVVGDVAGHGVAAAAVMAKLRYSARAYALCGATPGEVLSRTNRLLAHSGRDRLASMLYLEYDPRTGRATFANAGHPPALLVPPVGAATRLGLAHGPLLGVLDDAVYPVSSHDVRGGDALVLYTDGLIEIAGESLDVGIGRLAGDVRSAVRTCDRASLMADDLVRRRVARGPLTDDVCALVAVQR